MLSSDTLLRYKNKISYNDWVGLYDMYPSCVRKDYPINLSYINENNKFMTYLYFSILLLPFLLFFLYAIKQKFDLMKTN